MNRFHRRPSRRARRGAAAIEFAFTLPLLAATLLFTIEYAYFFSVRTQVVQAASQAARFAASVNANSDAELAAALSFQLMLEEMGIECDSSCTVDVTANSDIVELSVLVPYDQVTNAFPTDGKGFLSIIAPTSLPARVTYPRLVQ